MIEIEIDMDSNDKKHNYFYGYLTNICQIDTIWHENQEILPFLKPENKWTTFGWVPGFSQMVTKWVELYIYSFQKCQHW